MKNTDDLLNPYYIRDSLPLESKKLVPVIQVYEEVDSTNNILMQKNCIYPSGHACFAEKQYKGRGLSNKSWIAAESNVCFSVAWNYKETLKIPYMLNYYVAIKLVENLSKNGFLGIQCKWPNDLIFNGSKLGGILIDIVYRKDSTIYLVVGVGLNIKVSEDNKKSINQNIIDLLSVKSNYSSDRNKVSAILLNAVIESLSEFQNCDYQKLSEDWNNLDYNYNKLKTIKIDNKKIKAKLMGINNLGQLCCSHNDEISLYDINEVEIIKDEFLRN